MTRFKHPHRTPYLLVLLTILFLGILASAQEPEGAKLGVWTKEASQQWWADNPEPPEWFAMIEKMNVTLRDAHVVHGLSAMISNSHWTGWMIHTRWLTLCPENWEVHPFFSSPENRAIFVSLGKNEDLRDQFLAALSPDDDAHEAVTILCRIAQAHPEDFVEFSALAVAFAVVHDQPIPESWPHPFVEGAKVASGDLDPVNRFEFYVKCQRNKLLLHDLRRITVRNLTFLVDTTLEFKELGYAQQIRLSSPSKLKDLYTAVPYNMSRISGQRYIWPGATYRLIDIGKQGGICMDQAFFVSQTGKAKGVPTLMFTGQGVSGEHAWVGYFNSSGRWDMDVAKFRSENYPTGQAYDPQTWQLISDAELAGLIHGLSGQAGFGRGQKLLQWAALNKGGEFYGEILKLARQSMAQDPRPWRLEADFLEEADTPPEQLLAFYQEWVRNFAQNADLLVKGQMRLIAIVEEMGKTDLAERLRGEVMSRNKSKRFDLGIAIAAEPVFRNLRKRQYEVAESAFETAMRRFRSQAGGHLFHNLYQPYILTCLQEGQNQLAEDALQFAKDFDAVGGSILDNEIKALSNRVQRARK
ncbi:MAG: hypothetical protein ACI8UO_004002 [Verrucomicrobiales bacterium]|jgi:hypothetical protein